MVDQPIARPLFTHRTTQTQHKHTISMPRVGFKTTILVFKWAKPVIALDREPTVINLSFSIPTQLYRYEAIMLKDWHQNAIEAPEMKI
jgi:hypothetical protein